MRSVSIRIINYYYKCCIKPTHILFLYYIYCVPTFLWKKLIKQNHRAIKISTQHKENRICQNRTVCSNLDISNTSVTPKILKTWEDLRNLYINLLQRELAFYHTLVKKWEFVSWARKFMFFSKIKQLSPRKILKALLGTNTN